MKNEEPGTPGKLQCGAGGSLRFFFGFEHICELSASYVNRNEIEDGCGGGGRDKPLSESSVTYRKHNNNKLTSHIREMSTGCR